MAEGESEAPKQQKKKGGLVVVGGVVALMILEAVAVYVLVGMTGAASTSAAELALSEGVPDGERQVELELVKERFQNRSTGRVWLWETEIVLKVREKNLPRVESIIERRRAEIREGISKIIGSAMDRQLSEPGRQTMDRQITAYLNDVFGTTGEGEPRIDDVLLPTLQGHPADF